MLVSVLVSIPLNVVWVFGIIFSAFVSDKLMVGVLLILNIIYTYNGIKILRNRMIEISKENNITDEMQIIEKLVGETFKE